MLFAIARRTLDSGAGIVLEANFYRDGSHPPLRDLAERGRAAIVLCRTDDVTRRARFTTRGETGQRHGVHLDAEILAHEWSDDDARFAIDIGVPRLIVDTTRGYSPDLASIETFVRDQAG